VLFAAPPLPTLPRTRSKNVRGSVKKVILEKGFGFIRSDDGKEVFFHRSAVEGRAFGRLREGTPVSFEVEKTGKGPRAKTVRIESRESGNRTTEHKVAVE
jgi:CspA family cold shock protein